MATPPKKTPAKEAKKDKWTVDKELSDLASLFIVPFDDIMYLLSKDKKKK